MATPVDFAYYLGLLLAGPFLALKVARPRGRRHVAGLRERLGACPPRRGARPCLWIHGVSVGEIRAAGTLVEALERALPEWEIALSTTTATGHEVARGAHPGKRVFFFPVDFSWSVRRVFDAIRPDAVLLVELEVWPNFLHEASRRRVPVVIVNGRISERSFRRFRLLRRLFDPLSRLGPLCVQTDVYAQRFRELGVPAQQIHVTGSVKYDQLSPTAAPPDGDAVRADLGLGAGDRVLMGGSTHPGEEEALVAAFQALRGGAAALRLVLVPRHNERTDEVARLLERAGLRAVRRSAQPPERPPLARDEVLLVDTVGELGRLYAAADVVFVGGSLIPHGGQNVLEPVLLGKPTLLGPHYGNFREPVERLLAADGARLVDSAEALVAEVRGLLAAPGEAAALGERGRAALREAQGATARTAELVARYLRSRTPRLGDAHRLR